MIINVFNILSSFLCIIKKLKTIQKEFQRLNLLLIILIENINFPPEEQDYKTFEMNNKSIALNILQVNEQKISDLPKSEFNKTREKQVILLMINDNECNSLEKQHYLAVKKLNISFLKKRQIIVKNVV